MWIVTPFATLVAALALVNACGSDSGGADPTTSPDDATGVATDALPDTSDPTDVAPAADTTATAPFEDMVQHEWVWFDVAGTMCDDGTPTGIGISYSGTSDVLVFFAGGGACWDFDTCVTFNTSVHGPFGAAQLTAAAPASGFADRDDPNNPFRDWTYVFVPYCTGDLHGGSRDMTYVSGGVQRTLHHRGNTNVEAWLPRLVATLPHPDRLVVTGSSAGGYGATIQYDRLRTALGPQASWLLDDSGPLLVGDGIPAALRGAWYTSWQLASVVGPVCGDDCQDDLSLLYPKLAAKWPTDGMALLTSLQDQVIAAYLGKDATTMEAAVRALVTSVLTPAGTRAFVIAGATHTMLGAPLATPTSGDTTLSVWLVKMLTRDASWTTLLP